MTKKYLIKGHVFPDKLEVFVKAYEALEGVMNRKDRRLQKDDPEYDLVKLAIGHAFPGGAPSADGILWSDIYQGLSCNRLLSEQIVEAVFKEWSTWIEVVKESGDEITLTQLKPFDFKKIPKRIEIRSGQTVFGETKW